MALGTKASREYFLIGAELISAKPDLKACQVDVSGVYDLDKWRGAERLKSDLGKPALYS